jgi:hypothetical protein
MSVTQADSDLSEHVQSKNQPVESPRRAFFLLALRGMLAQHPRRRSSEV